MRRLIVVLALVLWGSQVEAQTGVPTSWTAKVYLAGASSPLQTYIITTAQATCNQAADPAWPAPPVENPTGVAWDDPRNAGRVCWHLDATRYAALGDGSYEVTLTPVNADGAGPEHARVPFVRRRPNPPGASTGLRGIK